MSSAVKTITFDDFDVLRHVAAQAVFNWSIMTFDQSDTHGIKKLPTLIAAGPVLADLNYPGEAIADEYLEARTTLAAARWEADEVAATRKILGAWLDYTTCQLEPGHWDNENVQAEIAMDVFNRLARVAV